MDDETPPAGILVGACWVREDGVRVAAHPCWPKLVQTRYLPAHPLIGWLARLLPIDPHVAVNVLDYAPPFLHCPSGTLYCAPEQREAMIAAGTVRWREDPWLSSPPVVARRR